MGRYVIVGASGYTGSRLAEYLLDRGHTVRGLVRNADTAVTQRLAGRGMVVWEGDLTQPDTLVGVAAGMEYVVNVTAHSVLDNGQVQRLFVEGNRNLIAACSRSRSVRSYVFAGNVAPYGDRGDTWLTEDTPIAPSFPLGHVIAEAEQVVRESVRHYRFPAMMVRMATIYGPERNMVDAVLNGTATIIGHGRNFVPRIHIDDVLPILDRIARDGQPGAVYNVGDDEPLRLVDVVGEVRRRLGMLPPRSFSAEMALHSGMDPSVVGMATASVRLSNERIRQELELTLRYASFREWLDQQLPARVELDQVLELAR